MRPLALVLTLFTLLWGWGAPANAQGENLLRDPGFEDTNMKVVATEIGEGTTFSVNVSWNGWYTTSPRNENWQNRIPNGTGRNNDGMGFVRTGNRSMELSRAFATFTAAVYQTVDVPAGATLRVSAWYVMDISENSSSQARVGIHPGGGTNPFDSAVVWSSWGGNQPVTAGWRQLSASAAATGGQVTVFLYTTQTVPTERNGVYWDDAELVITQAAPPSSGQPAQPATQAPPPASGGQPIVPNPPATAVTVVPVQANPDGSIVHRVNPGETTSVIARAYGVPLNTLLELNPSLGDGSLIRPGQLITIRPSPASAPPATQRPPVTLTPAPTEVAFVPESQQTTPMTAICVGMYEDANRNSLRDFGESNIAEGTLTLERDGQPVAVYQTDGNPQAHCFEDLEPGTYTIMANPPPGYTLVGGSPRRLVNVSEGSRLNVNFASFVGEATPMMQAPPPSAPLTELVVESPPGDGQADTLRTIGLIIFGLAGVTLVIGGVAAFIVGREAG